MDHLVTRWQPENPQDLCVQTRDLCVQSNLPEVLPIRRQARSRVKSDLLERAQVVEAGGLSLKKFQEKVSCLETTKKPRFIP